MTQNTTQPSAAAPVEVSVDAKIFYAGKACRLHRTTTRYRSTGRCFMCQDTYGGPGRATNELERTRKKYVSRRRRGLPEPTREEADNCECCGKRVRSGINLDHCHQTNRFRGWLCGQCNAAIGALGDTVAGLWLAIAYIRRFETQAETT